MSYQQMLNAPSNPVKVNNVIKCLLILYAVCDVSQYFHNPQFNWIIC